MTELQLAMGQQFGWTARFLVRLREDRVYFSIIGVFFALTAGLDRLTDHSYLLETTYAYLNFWMAVALTMFAAALSMQFVSRAVRDRHERPFELLYDVLKFIFTPETVAALILSAALTVFMGAFTAVKSELPILNDFWADPWLARADLIVNFGHDPWSLLQPVLGQHWITRAIEFVYAPVWTASVIFVPFLFCVTTRMPAHRNRFIMAYLLTWIVSGVILAGVFMSGGPAFYGELTHDQARYGELVRYLRFDMGTPFSAAWDQRLLWKLHSENSATVGAGISAFPSLHVSMILLCCLGVWQVSRRFACVFLAIAAVIVLGSVHLGWHYSVDTYAAILITLLIWKAADHVTSGQGENPWLRHQFIENRTESDANWIGGPGRT